MTTNRHWAKTSRSQRIQETSARVIMTVSLAAIATASACVGGDDAQTDELSSAQGTTGSGALAETNEARAVVAGARAILDKKRPIGLLSAAVTEMQSHAYPEATTFPDLSMAFGQTSRGIEALIPGLSESFMTRKWNAEVRLPASASDSFFIRDVESGIAVEAVLDGCLERAAEAADGHVVYRGAMGAGIDVIHRAGTFGIEDFVLFDRRPAREELEYRLDVSRVPGLRFVGNTLELLDIGGNPRLRIAPPYVVDSDGLRREATLELETCIADTSPAPPWNRPLTAKGSDTCRVRVKWDGTNLEYPLVVDPAWTTTGIMATPRGKHVIVALNNTAILVSGGMGPSGSLSSAEISDGMTWAATAPMNYARHSHAGTLLVAPGATYNGYVFVVGGALNGTELLTGEMYNPQTYTWSPTSSMQKSRLGHAVTWLASPTKKVLVTGGTTGGMTLRDAWLYDPEPAINSWTQVNDMSSARYAHSATVLPSSNKVIVVGGVGSGQSVDMYDPSTQQWKATAPLHHARSSHSAVIYQNALWVVGGNGANNMPEKTAEKFVPAMQPFPDNWNPVEGILSDSHADGFAGVVSNRLIVGGGTGPLATTEAYDEQQKTFVPAGQLVEARAYAGGAVLASGTLMVAGGIGAAMTPLATVEKFTPQAVGSPCTYDAECIAPAKCLGGGCFYANGATCTTGSDCGSNFCVDGRCCDTACEGECVACSNMKKGQGEDGICGPVKKGLNLDNECKAAGTQGTLCYVTGYCDGTGSCDRKLGVTCTVQKCLNATTQLNAGLCDGLGACIAQGTSPCGSYVCKDSACLAECTDLSDCAPGYVCLDKHCKEPLHDGKACVSDNDCASSFCVQGVCCNETCNGGCKSCKAQDTMESDGICSNVIAGKDPKDACSDGTEGELCRPDGYCDGNGQCHKHAQEGTTCGSTQCMNNTWKGGTCDAQGNCLQTESPCGLYKCVTTACPTSCGADAECIAGYVCIHNQCVDNTWSCMPDGHTARDLVGTFKNCKNYACNEEFINQVDDCPNSCGVKEDCVPGLECIDNACVAPADTPQSLDPTESGSCTVSTSTRGRTTIEAVLLNLALCFAFARRRRHST